MTNDARKKQPDGKGRVKHVLRRWALPLLVVFLLVAVALAVTYFGDEQGAASGGKRRSVEDMPQPFRWIEQRREAALLEEIKSLAEAKDERSFQRLLVLAVDRNRAVGGTAGECLGVPYPYSPPAWKADERAMARLLGALKDRDPDVRASAACVLGWLGDARAVEPFMAALKDADAEVRGTAASVLGELKDPRAVEPLIAALRDTDADVRASAAYALGRLKDPRAVQPLIAALNDVKQDVCCNAADGLRAITGANFGEDAEKWRAWWEENKGRLTGGNDE